ncbi:hypothetical protein BCR44DRAFT_1426219 [Catenaria anguillulae PL171]|uniref:Uncharacterized protein n=1 Tax=Catenaria anguillulae PL171 TaxID=765915 RepID=A0A1Y2I289_9FUNG|nr:hypothetical protein BCR44DRAFT_1426219 [Catenaria anguillulae PL171]
MLAAIRPGSARPNAFFIPLDEGRDRPRQPALPTFVRPASDSSRALRPRFANMDDESSGATKSTAHASINTVTEEDLLEDPVAAWASTPAVESTKSRVHRFPGVGINSLAAARHLTLSEPTLASERQEDPRLNSSARMSSRRHLGQQSTGILTAAVGAQDKLEDSAPSSSKRQAFSAPTSGRAPRPGTASRRTQAKLQNTLESIEAFLDPRRPPPSMTRASQQGHSIPVAQPAQRQPVTSRIPLPTPPQHLSFESVAGTPRLPSAIPHTRISTSAPPLPINGTPKNDNAGLQRPTRLTLSAKPSLGTENDDVPTRILKRIVQPVPPTRDELISARVEHRAHFSADVPSPPPPALTHRVSHDLAAMSGNTQLIDEASLVASLTRLSAEIDSRLSQLGVLPAPSLFSASASSAGIGKSSTKPTSLTTSTRSSARIRGSADTLASVESTVSLGRRRMAR